MNLNGHFKNYPFFIFTAWNCSFENGLCGVVNEIGDDFDWSLNSGSTISSGTGPSGDHTTGQGRIGIRNITNKRQFLAFFFRTAVILAK